jgi:hypothetical protein
MRQEHRLAALGEDILHRRHDALDPRGVGDATVLHRHVDVDAGQDDLAAKLHVIEGFPGHVCPSLAAYQRRRVRRAYFSER